MSIGQTKTGNWGNSTIGRNYLERITLMNHFDALLVNGVTYSDVIVIRVFQDYGSGSVQADYHLQRGVGFIKIDYFDQNWVKTATVSLSRKCQATSIPQSTCP
jgi:hypothetical protein